jgi:hypothetical protein
MNNHTSGDSNAENDPNPAKENGNPAVGPAVRRDERGRLLPGSALAAGRHAHNSDRREYQEFLRAPDPANAPYSRAEAVMRRLFAKAIAGDVSACTYLISQLIGRPQTQIKQDITMEHHVGNLNERREAVLARLAELASQKRPVPVLPLLTDSNYSEPSD